jgi:DNA processing protein
MRERDRFFALALSLLPSRFYKITLQHRETKSYEDIWNSFADGKLSVMPHLSSIYGTDPLKAAEKIIDQGKKLSTTIAVLGSSEYPRLLSVITDPPLVLYIKGTFEEVPALAVVGTREPALQTVESVSCISGSLAGRGVQIVSGMARGVDRAAHLAALHGAGTIGVLACGFGIVYPGQNRDLYKKITEHQASALVSEYPPFVGVQKWTFVRRNRIISALSSATLVCQAGKKSGALITARTALEQGRDVYAFGHLPGNQAFEGCNRLISQGASIVSDWRSFGMTFPFLYDLEDSLPAKKRPLEPREEKLIKGVKKGINEFDPLAEYMDISVSELSSLILEMEMSDLIKCKGSSVTVLV